MIRLPDRTVPEWLTVDALVRGRGVNNCDELAVEVAGSSLTYGELDRLSSQAAANLAALGVKKGDRVATMLYNSIEQILLFFGTVKIGAIWTPLNVSLVGVDLAHALTDSAPKVIVCDTETKPTIDALPQAARENRLIFIAGDPGAERPVDSLFVEPSAPVPKAGNEPGDPAAIIYTGGTTGLPKGVVLPHFAWIAAGYRFCEAFGVRSDDRHYSVLPLFHVGGSMIGLLGPMVAGIPTYFERWFSASRFWPRVRETGATIIDPIGTMVSVLCGAPPNKQDKDHSVRVSLGTLSQVPDDVVKTYPRRFGLEVVNVYSLTESGGTLIVSNPLGSEKPEANGKPWGWCKIGVLDEDDAPREAGVIGEICLRPTVPYTFMLEYFNDTEKTLECFRNLWLHTGDLGYLDEDGYLFFTGRQAHWMRIRGENVSAYEVENIISQYPGVVEVIVVGVRSELGDEDAKAFIISEKGRTVDPADLVTWCGSRMASFKVPRFVEFIDEFPRSATKREVERHKLRDMPNDKAWDATSVFGRRSARVTRDNK